MSIEVADFNLAKKYRLDTPGKCLTFGDCTYHFSSKEDFMENMNFNSIETIDVNGNPTYKLDLNDPLPESFNNTYDFILDSGTIYCCFDPCTVFKNIKNTLKIGGIIMHTGNLTGFFGRGYYSLSPALFIEFYEENGFEIKMIGTKTRDNRGTWVESNKNGTYLSEANTHYMNFSENNSNFIPVIPNDTMICCVAEKKKDVKFVKPVPRHFIKTNGK